MKRHFFIFHQKCFLLLIGWKIVCLHVADVTLFFLTQVIFRPQTRPSVRHIFFTYLIPVVTMCLMCRQCGLRTDKVHNCSTLLLAFNFAKCFMCKMEKFIIRGITILLVIELGSCLLCFTSFAPFQIVGLISALSS